MENLRRLLALAKAEDLGDGDVTADLLPGELQARGRFIARQDMIVCGAAMLETIACAYDESIVTTTEVSEGESVEAGALLAIWEGPAATMLSAERVALNFLQRLSGIATATGRYVQAAAGTKASIYDTRKTTPAWRALEKYAVRCGGGLNHRMGLYDAVLVKDNHLAALARAGRDDPMADIAAGFDAARAKFDSNGFVEIEVDTLDQLDRALLLAPDVVLLDNMTPDQLREAVSRRNLAGLEGGVSLEASGGVTLETTRAAAQTGVERIAIGALTHSSPAADVALDMEFD